LEIEALEKEEKKEEIPNKPYVTINGKEPEVPTSFLHSRRFIAVGVITALFMGAVSYLWIFAHH
jgi:hypothetical protein